MSGQYNLYTVTNNNPIIGRDPFGLIDWGRVFDWMSRSQKGREIIDCFCEHKKDLLVQQMPVILWPREGDWPGGYGYGQTRHTYSGQRFTIIDIAGAIMYANPNNTELIPRWPGDLEIALTLMHEGVHFCGQYNNPDGEYAQEAEAREAEIDMINDLLDQVRGKDRNALFNIIWQYQEEEGWIIWDGEKYVVMRDALLPNWPDSPSVPKDQRTVPDDLPYSDQAVNIPFAKYCNCKNSGTPNKPSRPNPGRQNPKR